MGVRPRLLFVGSFVTEHREQGGMNVQCRLLVESPLSRRIDFLLLDSTPPYLPPPPFPVTAWLGFRRLLKLIRILIFQRPDAALIFSSGGLSFLEKGLMAACVRAAGRPVLWSIRSGVFQEQVRRSRWFAAAARLLLRSPSRIVCQSDRWAAFYRDHLAIADERLFVFPNCIAATGLHELSHAREDGAGFRVLFVGHVKRAKGVFELVEAVTSLDELSDVRVDIVGYAEAFDELRAYVDSKDAADRIRLHGWRVGADLVRHFAEADVFVLPTYAEGFPNVLLEAMAAALPVVSTDVGAIPDVIAPGRNGILVRPRDAAALAQAIAVLKSDPEMRQRMSEQNRRDVREYSVERAAERLWHELTRVSRRFAEPGTSVSREP